MRRFCLWSIFFSLVVQSSLVPQEISASRLKMLYSGLEKTSILQHLAFYHLYPNTKEGQQAVQEAMLLMSGGLKIPAAFTVPSFSTSVQAIVSLVSRQGRHQGDAAPILTEEELKGINALADFLPNRRLAGYRAVSEAEVLALKPDQIDLGRAVLLSQLGETKEALQKILSYEASLDLMALQILARVDMNATPKQKIRVINQYIFEEMRFRFPPHSTHAKDIDLYTFLPSVLDSRKGVCLGVSILYICLSQRLNLKLEIITPPGHIYVRWKSNAEEINIETTARGTDIPSEEYLGIDTRSLQKRNIKEVVGLAHINQASVFWEREEYDQALKAYMKAYPYLPSDKQLISFIGIIHLLKDDEEAAKPLLLQIVDFTHDFGVSKETLAEDYFNGAVDRDGIKAVFMRVNETRESLLEKKEALEKTVKKFPRFREGLFSLAGVWLQLHRAGEALEVLKRYHEIDPENASIEYYLSALYAERFDYNNSWKHLKNAETLVAQRNHDPKALLELRRELSALCPE